MKNLIQTRLVFNTSLILLFSFLTHLGFGQVRSDRQILRVQDINTEVLKVIDMTEAQPRAVIEGREINRQIPVQANSTYYLETPEKSIQQIDPRIYERLTDNIKELYQAQDLKILPGKYVQTGANASQQLYYYIAFENKLPMEYNHDKEVFEGSLKFFLIPENQNPNAQLKTPLELEIVSPMIEDINPVSYTIDHFSIPMTTINLRDKDVADVAELKIITKAYPSGFHTEIPVKPDIQLYSGKRTLQGLGIERTPIEILAVGTNNRKPQLVSLSTEKGHFENPNIELSFPKPGIAYLRTAGIGKERIIARTGDVSSNVLELQYVFPWLFFSMSILGGILGGIIKVGTNKKVKARKAIPIGVLIGLLVALAWYVVEINLLTFDHSARLSELAVLTISAIGAFFGLVPKK